MNGETHNTETKEKARMVEKSEDMEKVIQEFEEIIRISNKNILWLP